MKKTICIIILIGIVVLTYVYFTEREPKFWAVEKDGIKDITPDEAMFKLYGLTCDEVWAELDGRLIF